MSTTSESILDGLAEADPLYATLRDFASKSSALSAWIMHAQDVPEDLQIEAVELTKAARTLLHSYAECLQDELGRDVPTS